MTRTTTHGLPASGGCGCGGSAGTGGGCACGAGTTKVGTGTLRRPRFFAGQLLTEDDLGLLEDYVVGKNRLRNRHLFGDGVVCGLRVLCHDCDEGSVSVEAGYALDCCGNDIVVPCPIDLDVLALVEELRAAHGGVACGDPCREGGELRDGVTRRYYLYLVYDEELEEPVAPYATDESCEGPCEPTRIAEGHRFELRCAPDERPGRADLLSAIRECVGDLPELGLHTGRILKNQQLGTTLTAARRAIAADVPFHVDGRTLEGLEHRMDELEERDLVNAGNDPDAAYATTETIRLVRQDLALLRDADPERLAAVGIDRDELQEALDEYDHRLEVAVARTPVDRVLATMEEHDRVAAAAVYRLVDAEADADQRRLSAAMAKAGTPFDSRSQADYSQALARIREWLLIRLEKSATVTSCRLRDEVAAIRIDLRSDAGADVWLESFRRAALALASAFFAYLIDCVCAALNPPCPPCDDDAVLLACLEVEDCEVVDICNQVRTQVLAPTAIRYWFGTPFDLIGRAVEYLCCEFSLRFAYQDPTVIDDDFGQVYVPNRYVEFQGPSDATTATIADRVEMSAASRSALDSVVRGVERTTAAGGGSTLDALGIGQLAAPIRASTLAVPALDSAAETVLQAPVERILARRGMARAAPVVGASAPAPGGVAADLEQVRRQVSAVKGRATRDRNDTTKELEELKAKLAELERRLDD